MHKAVASCCVLVFLSASAFCGVAAAQTASPPSLPDAPDATTALASSAQLDLAADQSPPNEAATPPQTTTTSSPDDQQDHQSKRILGIIPNFRAVSTNQILPRQSAKEKFITASEDSFDYSALFIPTVLAGYSMATDETPEFHQGAAGYARYFWHTFADQSIENYFVEFIVPAPAHEDIRYYTLGNGGFFKRTGYALSRAVITRSDTGTETFNFGEVIGAGAAAGVSNLYYPTAERTFSNTAQKWGINVGVDAATFVFKEFWPDINRAVFHNRN
jgi:DNA-binding PucR family transcriptional regulator